MSYYRKQLSGHGLHHELHFSSSMTPMRVVVREKEGMGTVLGTAAFLGPVLAIFRVQ